MSMTAFILIVGLVLLTMAAINEAIALLIRLYEHDTRHKRCKDCCHSYDDIGGLVCSYGPCVDCLVPEDFYCKHGDSHRLNAR